MPEARTIPLPHVPTADAVPGGWSRVLVLREANGDPRTDLAMRAFPGATQVGCGSLGLPPCRRLPADEATQRVADFVARPAPATALLVTTLDLTLPDIDSVLGFSIRRRGAAVVSLARLCQSRDGPGHGPADERDAVRRVRNVAAHEAGHLRGLSHCRSDTCVMHSAGGARDVDRRSDVPCVACERALRRRELRAGSIWLRLLGRRPSGANP